MLGIFFLLLFLHCTLSVIRSLYCICLWLDRIKVPSQMRGRWKKAMQFVFICFSRAFLIVLGFFFWQTTFALFNGLQFSNILQLVIAVFEVIQASYCVVFYIVFFSLVPFPSNNSVSAFFCANNLRPVTECVCVHFTISWLLIFIWMRG